MTQGAPKETSRRTTTPKPKPNPLVKPDTADEELDLDALLAARGLAGERRMKVGGKWFRFTKSATSAQLAQYSTAQEKGNLRDMISAFLVDPAEIDEFFEAFADQRQPIDAAAEQEWLRTILGFIVTGNVGESSAS